MTSMVNPRRCAFGGAILLAGCLLLTACAGSGASSAPSSGQAAPARVPGSHANAADGTAGSAGATGTAGPAGAKGTGLTAGLTPANQSIIYTAAIAIRARDVAATARRITGIAAAAGGYVSAENAGSAGSASPGGAGEKIGITLKIPVPSYPAVLAQLSSPALGQQLSMNQHASDVTQQVANVSSLVTSQQAAIAALEGLLRHAASVADLLQVQQQISADETSLNSLLAQQRALNGETSYATVTMTLVGPRHAAMAHAPARHSFLTGLLAGWRGLRHAAGWVATALGAALPFAVVVLAVGIAGFAGWRRYQRRRAAGPPAAA